MPKGMATARLLRVLALLLFWGCILAIVFTPLMVLLKPGPMFEGFARDFKYIFQHIVYDVPLPEDHVYTLMMFLISWIFVWMDGAASVITLVCWVAEFFAAVYLWRWKNQLVEIYHLGKTSME